MQKVWFLIDLAFQACFPLAPYWLPIGCGCGYDHCLFFHLIQDLKAQIAQGEADRGAKAESKASKLQAKADASGNLNDTTSTKNADSKYLADY